MTSSEILKQMTAAQYRGQPFQLAISRITIGDTVVYDRSGHAS